MLEPVDLLGVEGVVQHNCVRASVSVCQHTIQGLKKAIQGQKKSILGLTIEETHHSWSERFESDNGDPIVRLDQLVVGLVVEGQRQHTLLLQVCFVDPGDPKIQFILKSSSFEDGNCMQNCNRWEKILPIVSYSPSK